MDDLLFERLLNEAEGAYLDFKRDQYPFEGASDEEKSELLKDILAFANAWRRTDAYILIGVVEIRGGRSSVIGVGKHLDDHSLQQFVNKKTQRPVEFSYLAFTFEEKQIGVIHIPVQTRPVYLTRDFAKLRKNVVYVRRGSSTDEAAPDESAKMGTNSEVDSDRTSVELQFCDTKDWSLLGTTVDRLSRTLVLLPGGQPVPDFEPEPEWPPRNFLNTANESYYRDLVAYFETKLLVTPIGFAVYNSGSRLARRLRMEIEGTDDTEFVLMLRTDLPNAPRKYHDHFLASSLVNQVVEHKASAVTITRRGQRWSLEVEFGDLQPKARSWSDAPVYLGCRSSSAVELSAKLFADNLPDPISVPLGIKFTAIAYQADMDRLEAMREDEIRERERQWRDR